MVGVPIGIEVPCAAPTGLDLHLCGNRIRSTCSELKFSLDGGIAICLDLIGIATGVELQTAAKDAAALVTAHDLLAVKIPALGIDLDRGLVVGKLTAFCRDCGSQRTSTKLGLAQRKRVARFSVDYKLARELLVAKALGRVLVGAVGQAVIVLRRSDVVCIGQILGLGCLNGNIPVIGDLNQLQRELVALRARCRNGVRAAIGHKLNLDGNCILVDRKLARCLGITVGRNRVGIAAVGELHLAFFIGRVGLGVVVCVGNGHNRSSLALVALIIVGKGEANLVGRTRILPTQDGPVDVVCLVSIAAAKPVNIGAVSVAQIADKGRIDLRLIKGGKGLYRQRTTGVVGSGVRITCKVVVVVDNGIVETRACQVSGNTSNIFSAGQRSAVVAIRNASATGSAAALDIANNATYTICTCIRGSDDAKVVAAFNLLSFQSIVATNNAASADSGAGYLPVVNTVFDYIIFVIDISRNATSRISYCRALCHTSNNLAIVCTAQIRCG